MHKNLRAMTIALCLGAAAACNGHTSQPASPASIETFVLSGTVFESNSQGSQPSMNRNVFLYRRDSSKKPYAYIGSQRTDAQGRFSFAAMPSGSEAFVSAIDGDLLQPCLATGTMSANVELNVGVVSRTDFIAGVRTADMNRLVLSGTVRQNGLPVSAFVGLSLPTTNPPIDGNSAETMSDANGHYRICGLPVGPLAFGASLGSSHVDAERSIAGDLEVDLNLPPPRQAAR